MNGDPVVRQAEQMHSLPVNSRRRPPGRLLLVLLPVLLLVNGCGVIGGWFDGKHQVGALLQSWSQGDYMKIETIAPEATLVLADDAARNAYLRRVPDELDIDRLRAADLDSVFLVLGAYNKCMEQSRVWMDDDRTAVWFEDYIAREDRNIACAWSPVTIDIWQVPRTALADVPAGELITHEPN